MRDHPAGSQEAWPLELLAPPEPPESLGEEPRSVCAFGFFAGGVFVVTGPSLRLPPTG